eukprot:m.181975 g.181975  ORF g.181975 m.181975 type:complete len:551 (-) comp15401_c0_seq1:104-1756(-)
MKRSISRLNVPVAIQHACVETKFSVLVVATVLMCFVSMVFVTKSIAESGTQCDPGHIAFHSRHREECEHREMVTTRSLEKVLGDLLTCKQDLQSGGGVALQDQPLNARSARRDVDAKECPRMLHDSFMRTEKLEDALRVSEMKQQTKQLQIDNLQASLHKSAFFKSKNWVKGTNLLAGTAPERGQAENLRMYVYDMPKFNVDFYSTHEEDYKVECKNQIGERHIHSLFETSPNRVLDGERADIYFVPVYTGCYRSVMGRELQMDAYNATYDFIQRAMNVVKEQPFWSRSQGKDHVWMFLYDYGVCLEYAQYQAKTRTIPPGLENSIFIGYVGDTTPGHSCFSTWKDIAIPAYITNPAIVAGRGGVAVDPEKRTTLVHFRGSITWPLSQWHTAEMNYSHGVRDLINRTYHDDPLFSITQGATPNYVHEIETSVFCLTPLGYSLWSFRFYESVMLGCIPVIIADHIELPFEDTIDYRSFTVKILESQVLQLKEILLSIPKSEIRKKQTILSQVWRRFVYNEVTQPNDAFDTLLQKLLTKVQPKHPLGLAYYQ